MTEEERMKKINANYEHDKAQLVRDEMKFGNMNYYLKKEEFIKKNLWKTADQVYADVVEAIKNRIRS